MKHWHRHRGTLQVVFDEPPLTIINRHHMVDRLTIATISCQIMDRLLEMGECLDRTMRDATGRLFLGRSWTLAVAGGNGPYLQIRCICMLVIVFSVYWFNYLEHLLCFFVSLLFLSLSLYIYIYYIETNQDPAPLVNSLRFTLSASDLMEASLLPARKHGKGEKKQVMGNLLWHKWDLELSG